MLNKKRIIDYNMKQWMEKIILNQNLFVVIPSQYTSRKVMLNSLIKKLNLPAQNIIIVRTQPGKNIKNVTNIFVDGDLSIYKWWNTGINAGLKKNGKYFLICNDDVSFNREDIMNMFKKFKKTKSAIAINHSKFSPGWGYCFMIDFSQGGYFDERFSWWYGDTDYLKQIEKRKLSISYTCFDFINLDPNGSIKDNLPLKKQIKKDYRQFRLKYKLEYKNYILFNLSYKTTINRFYKLVKIIINHKDRN